VRGLVAGRTLRPEDKEERRRGHEEEGSSFPYTANKHHFASCNTILSLYFY
jgi:hypothetical protein